MARELGVISDLQSAELLVGYANLTLGFDATTQEVYMLTAYTLPAGTNVLLLLSINCLVALLRTTSYISMQCVLSGLQYKLQRCACNYPKSHQ